MTALLRGNTVFGRVADMSLYSESLSRPVPSDYKSGSRIQVHLGKPEHQL